jgi:3-isopropylmalate dehydrogenase
MGRKSYKIAVIPGDGTGPEVIREGVKVLEAAGRRFDITFDWNYFDWGGERYLKTGETIPEGGLEELKKHDAITWGLLGILR